MVFPPKLFRKFLSITKASCKVRGRAAQQGDAQGLMWCPGFIAPRWTKKHIWGHQVVRPGRCRRCLCFLIWLQDVAFCGWFWRFKIVLACDCGSLLQLCQSKACNLIAAASKITKTMLICEVWWMGNVHLCCSYSHNFPYLYKINQNYTTVLVNSFLDFPMDILANSF
jgi:hypothetical protein